MKKIALVLLRTLGDVVLINTLAETVKNWYGKDTHLTVFVNPEWAEIVRNNPTIDVVKAEYEYSKHFDGICNLYLNGEYDEILVPYQTTREDNAWHQFPETRNQNLLDFYMKRMGIPRTGEHVDRKLRMYPHQEDDIKAINTIDEEIKSDFIVFHTTSGNQFKDLSLDSWKMILEYLSGLGYTLVQVGLPSDKTVAFEPHITDGNKYVDLRGKVSINEAYCLIKRAEAFLGLDSGMSFVAAASGVKTFVFYGCTIPMTSGPWGPNVHAYVSKECNVAQERNHVRCHSQCNSPKPCMTLMVSEDLVSFIRDRVLKPEEITV